MRLSDVIGHLTGQFGLAFFPVLGLVIFLAVFLAVSLRALRNPRHEMTRCASLPLHGGEPGETAPTTGDQPHA